MDNVTRHTRAGRNGKDIYCPHGHKVRVYHFSWNTLACPGCKGVNDPDWFTKPEWLLEPPVSMECPHEEDDHA